jgi:competence protein ComEC
LGARSDWSPLDHIYTKYIPRGRRLDRIVLTHHHGDHLDDVYNLTTDRMPAVVLRRHLAGRYEEACEGSNSDGGQRKARHFDRLFSGYTGSVATGTVGGNSWGIDMDSWALTESRADQVGGSDGGMVNCCSYVTLYNHQGTKVLQCGDMEKDGMSVLLAANSDMLRSVRGTNVLIAPHHGHKSGFSTELMQAIGKPNVVIASVMAGDEHVDSRYSDPQFVRGIPASDGSIVRLLTARTYGAVTVVSQGAGSFSIRPHER